MDNKYTFVCRVCLVKDPSSVMRSLADQEIRELLIECTSLSVKDGDKYPQQLCRDCWNQCKSWSNFKNLAHDSDRQLILEEEEQEKMMKNQSQVTVDKEEEDEQLHYIEGYSLSLDQQMAVPLFAGKGVCNQEEIITLIKEEQMDEEDVTVMVKEEPLEYIEGYSLATEEEQDYPTTIDTVDHPNEEETRETRKETPKAKSKVLKYNCAYCPKVCSKSSERIRHERVHTNERPFPCDKCEKMFKTRSDLVKHKWGHVGGRELACDQCDKKYTNISNLKQHKLIHGGVKRFACDLCGKKFSQKSSLTPHMLSHADNKPFKCELCGNMFKHKRSLGIHVKTLHK